MVDDEPSAAQPDPSSAQYDALVGDLSTALDLDSGFAEVAQAGRFSDLVTHLADVLDVDAGLKAITGPATEEGRREEARGECRRPGTSSSVAGYREVGAPPPPRRRQRDTQVPLSSPLRERGARALVALVDELNRDTSRARRPDPLLVLWRWRWESVLVAMVAVLARSFAPEVLLVMAALVVPLVLVPRVRRALRVRFWCVVTQHRIRKGMSEADVRSWSGRLPAVVWTSGSREGERVLLACPAGVDVAQIEAARHALAAACWAVDASVRRHPRYGNLAVVEVWR